MALQPDKITIFIEGLIILFFGIGLHEYAHCKLADMAGDPTPSYYGRVTLNLFKHLDPIGSIMMVITCWIGFGFGWGKPAPINPQKMRNPRIDTFIAVIGGPLTNFLQALLYAAVFRVLKASGGLDVLVFCELGVLINLGLALFNLIPIFPLDGHWLVGLMLPEPAGHRWFQMQKRLGIIGVIAVIYFVNMPNNFLDTGVLKVTGAMLGIQLGN